MPACFLMKMKRNLLFAFAALLLGLTSCNKGDELPNVAPETRISLTSINLTGDDRLRSEVTLHWYGEDKDGWVTGYELSFDGTTWTPVDVQDSTFKFSLTLGSDTTDIDFYVRAVDNDDDFDLTPAYLRIPIKNSPPTALFDSILALPDTAFIATTIFLNVNDGDGIDNLDSIFISLDGTTWFAMAPTINTITLLPADPEANGPVAASVSQGTAATLLPGTLNGLNLNGNNTFYLKARDIAGSESAIDTSTVVFIKRKSSDLLVIDAHPGGSSPTPEQVYAQTLDLVEPNADRIDLRANGGSNVPRLWSPTFSKFIGYYKRIFWYGDGSDIGLGLLEDASGAIQGYLNQGGKILINCSFPSSFDNASVLQEYTPLDSVSTSVGNARLPSGNLIEPTAAFASTFDTLQASANLARATPMYVKSNAETIYNGNFTFTGGWVGPSAIAARASNGSGQTNLVLVTVELHQLFGRPSNLQDFFTQVLLNEFNW